MNSYGKELILDLKNCDVKTFTRKSLKKYFIELCDLIKMECEDLHFWDYKNNPEEYRKAPDHLKGISAIQFIKTSNITIHTLDVSGQCLINIFSCKEFDGTTVILFSEDFFKGKLNKHNLIYRGEK